MNTHEIRDRIQHIRSNPGDLATGYGLLGLIECLNDKLADIDQRLIELEINRRATDKVLQSLSDIHP